MQNTLLGIVQDILSSMGSDEVNSIADTTEALQVARCVKEAYYELITRKDWPHMRKYIGLDSASDVTSPTSLVIPTLASRIDTFSYDVRKDAADSVFIEELTYLYPEEFAAKCNLRDPSATNAFSAKVLDEEPVVPVSPYPVNYNPTYLTVYNDQPPTYWTSFDDRYVMMDSWVETISSTVQGTSSQALIYVTPAPWTTTDDYHFPDLPAEVYPALFAEAKSIAFNDLVEAPNAKAEQQAKRQYRMLTQRGWISNGGVKYPNYGRK